MKKQWGVALRYGCVSEKIVFESDLFDDAETAYYELYTESERSELGVAIVKRLPDGEIQEV